MTGKELAGVIDQTNLSPGVSTREITAFCEEAAKHSFASVCVLPVHVATAARVLRGTKTKVCTVLSFPLGEDTAEVKLFEAQDAMKKGATELDVVVNVGAVKGGDKATVMKELSGIVAAAHAQGSLVKVIIEMPLLSESQATEAAVWAEEAGADIVKTSTGFKGLKLRATTAEDVALLRRVLKPTTGVKAAGGVRTREDAEAMIRAGANRIGASSGVAITAS